MGFESTALGDPAKATGEWPAPKPVERETVAAAGAGAAVAAEASFPAPQPRAERTLWQAEKLGALFEASRVRRITLAQDALSLVEEKVYDILWGPRNLRRDEFRLVHYSLQRLSSDARINIKTVRELIPRLIDKGFVDIECEADPRRNTATLYRVWSYTSVLQRQRQRGRLYVVKTGKGVFYAFPVSASLEPAPTPMGLESAPIGVTPPGSDPSPMGPAPLAPVGAGAPRPLGAGAISSIDIELEAEKRQTSSATYAAIVAAIRDGFGVEADSSLVDAMLTECHRNAVATTGTEASDAELVYFAQSKVRALAGARNIRNHVAVLRRALPECFQGEAFRIYRKLAGRRMEAAEVRPETESAQTATESKLERWTRISERHRDKMGYDLKAIAADAEMDDDGRRVALGMAARVGRYSRTGV
jgi:predicted transcriptional regulator